MNRIEHTQHRLRVVNWTLAVFRTFLSAATMNIRFTRHKLTPIQRQPTDRIVSVICWEGAVCIEWHLERMNMNTPNIYTGQHCCRHLICSHTLCLVKQIERRDKTQIPHQLICNYFVCLSIVEKYDIKFKRLPLEFSAFDTSRLITKWNIYIRLAYNT